MRGFRNRPLTGVGVVVTAAALLATVAAPATAAPAALAAAQPGAPGIGDSLFPGLGNGGYDAQHYDLQQRYDTVPTQTVPGRVTMNAVATQSLSSFNLDFAGTAVTSVKVDGQAAKFVWQQDEGELVITPAAAICRGQRFTAEVAYTAGPKPVEPGNLYPVGWIGTRDGSYTSFQPDTAHTAIPVNDHPADKATWSFTLDVPTGVNAVTNGVNTGKRTNGDRTVWSFQERSPLATELMQIAVGTDLLIKQRRTVSGVQYRDVIAAGPQSYLEPAFAQGPAQLQWAMDKVGIFPHPIYGNLGIDQCFGYALETQGISLHSECLFNPTFIPGRTGQEWFYSSVMVHEIAHEWYGNSVSPRRWSDLWLNEGWATYFMKIWEEERDTIDEWGNPSLDDYMREVYSQGDIWRTAYGPVARPASAQTLFSENVYDGGALVLYALRLQVGDAAFDRIMKGWPSQNKDSSRSTDDFIAFASRTSGKDLRAFMRAWVYGTTTPPMPHRNWTVDPVTDQPVTTMTAGHNHGTQQGWALAAG